MVLYKRKKIRFIVSIAVLLFLPLFGNAATTEESEEEILFITSYNSDTKYTYDQGERSITCTSYYSLYFFNPNDFISYFLVPSTRFPLSCHSQFDIALF